MRIVESLLAFMVASLNLAVVPGGIGRNQFVTNTEFVSGQLKEGREIALGVREPISEAIAMVKAVFLIGEILPPLWPEECIRWD